MAWNFKLCWMYMMHTVIKVFDYAVAYADTMIHQDGSIETYKLEEYNIDRLNSGKMLSVFTSRLRTRNTKSIGFIAQSIGYASP